MKHLIAAVQSDLRLQLRYGLWGVYALITAFYILGLRLLPPEYGAVVAPLIIFSDPSFVGFFFIGGLVLLEKGEMTLDYLAVTPLGVHEYILAKLISLTGLALVASLIIVPAAGADPVNYPHLIAGIILTSAFFTLCGLMAAIRCSSVNAYLLNAVAYILILSLPLAALLGRWPVWVSLLFPAPAALVLIWGAFRPVPTGDSLVALIFLLLAAGLAYGRVHRLVSRYVFTREE